MGSLKGLISRGVEDEGYIEKETNAQLDSKTANKGSNNYTKYSRDVNNWGLMGCQGQPWCCTMQFALEGYEYGKDVALQHWNMTPSTYVGYNCFLTYNAFKKAGKVGMTPQLGAVVIFDFSHAGRVIRIYSQNGQKWWDCLEGNTSSNLSERNGGQVKIKTRPWNDATVKGFCYIDYDEDDKPGWIKDQKGYWYRRADGSYPANKWCIINHHYYLFNRDGYMVTGWHRWDGKVCNPDDGSGDWYFLDSTKDGPLEGACWHTKDNGAQEIWLIDENDNI